MTIEIWATRSPASCESTCVEALDPQGPVADMITSGARGSVVQLHQMAGMKGLITNPRGETIEIPDHASLEGRTHPDRILHLDPRRRKGLADTALNTAKAGYLTRRLFDVAQDVRSSKTTAAPKHGVMIARPGKENIGGSFADRLAGRVLAEEAAQVQAQSPSQPRRRESDRRRRICQGGHPYARQ